MWDSQKKKSINLLKSWDSQEPFSSITLKKDSREGSIVFTSSRGIVQSINMSDQRYKIPLIGTIPAWGNRGYGFSNAHVLAGTSPGPTVFG